MTYIHSLIISLILIHIPLGAVSATEYLKERLYKETSAKHVSLSYLAARRKLFGEIYLEKDERGYFIEGVYCQKSHYPFGGKHPNGRIPNHTVFNTEHSWPQSKFNSRFRKSVQKTDLHHLFPTYSRINSERGNLPFAEVNASRDLSCAESNIGRSVRQGKGIYFEPPESHKGNLARAMFYFSIRYKISIDPVQEYYLKLWHKEDPVDQKERERHEKIFRIQRNRNPFIDNPALVEQIKDF